MKQAFITILLMLLPMLASAQTFIRTVDKNNYWSESSLDQILAMDEIPVNDSRRIIRIKKSDIVLLEDMEAGLKILQPDKINKIEPRAFNDNLESFLAKGKRVYIPLASSITQQRWGARQLRELFEESDYWELVGCEDEADFILEYVFEEKGRDKANIVVTDRMGRGILYTTQLSANDWVPADAGKESAEKLFKYFFLKCVCKGKIKSKAKFIKNPSPKTFNCSYNVRIKL